MQFAQEIMPSMGRGMIFIDGENLVARYQAMVDEGWKPGREGVVHEPDVYVWEPNCIYLGPNVVLRATYYTYVQGSAEGPIATAERIKRLRFQNYRPLNTSLNGLPDTLTPCVFQKQKGRKAKGVDIQITVDMLTHAYQDNCDVFFLASGDGDYAPVVAELQRLGKLVFLYAFSSGLNPKIRLMADRFMCLDSWFFEEAGRGMTPDGVERPTAWP